LSLANATLKKRRSELTKSNFALEEATVDDVHAAFASGDLTAKGLVSAYLARIQDIDKTGPTLNSVISINSKALKAAEALDNQFATTGNFIGPLHGIPIVVKDQVETKGIMTTASPFRFVPGAWPCGTSKG
jgi:amidase